MKARLPYLLFMRTLLFQEIVFPRLIWTIEQTRDYTTNPLSYGYAALTKEYSLAFPYCHADVYPVFPSISQFSLDLV